MKVKSKIPSYGLEIGDSGIRLARLVKSAKGIEIEEIFFYDFPPKLEPIDTYTIVTTIKDFIRDTKFPSLPAVVNLYGGEPVIKFMTLPFLNEEELKKTIKWEAAKFIVYDLEKMILDYAVLNELKEEGRRKLNIVVVTSMREVVANEIEFLKEAGVEPLSIDVDTLAHFHLLKVCGLLNSKEVNCFVDIGARKVTIQVYNQGIPCFYRECLTIGSLEINKILSEELKINLRESEDIKKNFSFSISEGEIYPIISRVMEQTLIEIKRSLDFFMDSFPHKKITQLFLMGGGACMKGIDLFFRNQLGIDVKIFDPLKILPLSEGVRDKKILENISPRLSTVLGLALEALE